MSRFIRGALFGFLAVMVLAGGAAAGALRIPLVIDDPAGVDGLVPITCGVPFPKGFAAGAGAMHLVDGSGAEVPCQIDETATWLDGSVRWVLLNFRGLTDGEYALEVGAGVRRTTIADGIRVTLANGQTTVDTGAAQFILNDGEALVDTIRVDDKPILLGAGSGAYIVDNHDRRAVLGGPGSEIEMSILEHGAMRTVLRTEGWYVRTGASGDSPGIARGILWHTFYKDSPRVEITHRIVLTSPTTDIWFKDIGIDLPTGLAAAAAATFDIAEEYDNRCRELMLGKGESAWILQEEYPHFKSDVSRFVLGRTVDGKDVPVTVGKAAGQWCDLSAAAAGLSVVLRAFAEQYPKAFTLSRKGVTVHLWAPRSGKELDFRTETLSRDYWGDWAAHSPGGIEALNKVRSDAQASAKTHEFILMPHAGALDVAPTVKRAHAADLRIFAMADKAWNSASGALGIVVQPKDAGQFPAEEAFMEDMWARMVTLPLSVFPMNGYLAWGCHPFLRYLKDSDTGRWYADWYRLRHLVEYHLRRHGWTMYARSGERQYIQYLERFNRFAGDMEMHHWNTGNKWKGAFVNQAGSLHLPLWWGSRSEIQRFNSSGTDIWNYLFEYYFSGSWPIRELATQYAAGLKQRYDVERFVSYGRPLLAFRCLIAAYTIEWDERLGEIVKEVASRIVVPQEQHGMGVYHSKIGPNAQTLVDYWKFCGSDVARESFLHFVEFQYRYQKHGVPLSYQNGAGGFYALGYEETERVEYLQLARQSLVSAMRFLDTPLEEELKQGLAKLRRFPGMGSDKTLPGFFSPPLILKFLAEANRKVAPFPIMPKYYDSAEAWAAFEKPAAHPVNFEICFHLMQQRELEIEVFNADGKAVDGWRIIAAHAFNDPGTWTRGEFHFYARVELPAELPAGLYFIGHATRDEWRILKSSVEKVVLVCPQGVWVGGNGLYREEDFFFKVPEGLTDVKLFLGRPVTVLRPDGSEAKDRNGEQIGAVSLPVSGRPGFWRLRFSEPGIVKFRNVKPIVCYADTDRYFEPPIPAAFLRIAPPAPPVAAQFVDGVAGMAIQLNDGDVLRYDRGAKHADGSYDAFPGEKGTIEFWFRPNWRSDGFSFVDGWSNMSRNFVSAGGNRRLYHYIAAGPYTTMPYGYIYEQVNEGPGRSTYGAQARYFFRQGDWVHLAATWEVTKERADAHVFVNGEKRERTWLFPWPLPPAGRFTLQDIEQWIKIGPADGAFDELRISDVVRYSESFTPSKASLEADKETKALFRFDGAAEGVGAGGAKLQVEYRNAD